MENISFLGVHRVIRTYTQTKRLLIYFTFKKLCFMSVNYFYFQFELDCHQVFYSAKNTCTYSHMFMSNIDWPHSQTHTHARTHARTHIFMHPTIGLVFKHAID